VSQKETEKMKPKFYRVKDWAEKQHYKDRNPPWIKLHKALLTSFRFSSLSVASKALAPLLWLLASEHEKVMSGLITSNHEEISFKVHVPLDIVNESIKELIDKEYIEIIDGDDSVLLAECKQVATPETYREETESQEQNPPTPLKGGLDLTRKEINHGRNKKGSGSDEAKRLAEGFLSGKIQC